MPRSKGHKARTACGPRRRAPRRSAARPAPASTARGWRRRPRAAGFLPARPRRLLAPLPAATGLTLAVAWGPPLEPFALEAIDLFKAAGLTLAPLHIGRDRELPPGAAGLLLTGLLDEEELPAFATNDGLKTSIADAVGAGLPTLAFGGGSLLLLRRLADSRGRTHELAGVLPAEAELLEWYDRPRYVRAAAARENLYDEGETTLYELFDLEFLTLQQEAFAYRVGEAGEEGQVEGFVHERCLATTPGAVPAGGAAPGLCVHRRDADGGTARVSPPLAALARPPRSVREDHPG